MSYIINYTELQCGDIILDRNSSRESEVIRKRANSDYSHARLYVGGTLIESEGLGVQAVNPQRLLYDNPDDFIVLRPTTASQEQRTIACLYARSQVGREYAGYDFKKSLLKPVEIEEPNRQFCTRLIAQSYRFAGYDIVQNADYCTPNEIQSSAKLMLVENMFHKATEKEIAIADNEGIMKMKDETNDQNLIYVSMLEDMRNVTRDPTCDIQTEDDMVSYIIEHPEYDDVFSNILISSKYFRLWKIYEDENPEEFDATLLIKKYGNFAHTYARYNLMTPQDNFIIWKRQLLSYANLFEKYSLQLFFKFAEMYSNIIKSYNNRKNTFLSVLNNNLE